MGNLSRLDGALTKREAYQKIKTRLGLSKKEKIFKEVFSILYLGTGDLYLPAIPETEIDRFFLEYDLKTLNERIFLVKERSPSMGLAMYHKAITSFRVAFKSFKS